MKLTADTRHQNPDAAIAYIDPAGDLLFRPYKCEEGTSGNGVAALIAASLPYSIGQVKVYKYIEFTPGNPRNRAVFYPGDKVTITF